MKHWSSTAIVLVCLTGGCDSKLVVGSWTCPARDADLDPLTTPVVAPWSTGFEQGLCDYTRVGGFCYAAGNGSYELVTSQVHSGSQSMAFHVTTNESDGGQARCVRPGELPPAAYYGAWYYIENAATNLDNWNLFFFQGGDGNSLHGLWDVTITEDSDGLLRLTAYDQMRKIRHSGTPTQSVPIGRWFHIQLFLERAADATGRLALYQDGTPLIELENLVTDDSSYAQWYVGNLANALTPPDSTIYVDDIAITLEL